MRAIGAWLLAIETCHRLVHISLECFVPELQDDRCFPLPINDRAQLNASVITAELGQLRQYRSVPDRRLLALAIPQPVSVVCFGHLINSIDKSFTAEKPLFAYGSSLP